MNHPTRLTSAELGTLWSQYLNDSLATCTLRFFLEKATDMDFQPLLDHAIQTSQNNLAQITQFFSEEGHVIPAGFSDKDINLSAPRLFSDEFAAQYVHKMTTISMTATGVTIGLTARPDIKQFFTQVLQSSMELHNEAHQLLLDKGIYIRSPYIPVRKQVEYVQRQQFLTGFFGKRHPLTAIEISHLYSNHNTNALGKALMIGFGQVASLPEVSQYMNRGKQIASKHMEVFGSVLIEENLPAPMAWDHMITDSTISPFSDRLMMYHTTTLIQTGVGNYGTSLSLCQRRDLAAHYSRLSSEVLLYGEDGANIMIKNGWLEEPPHAANRDKLMSH